MGALGIAGSEELLKSCASGMSMLLERHRWHLPGSRFLAYQYVDAVPCARVLTPFFVAMRPSATPHKDGVDLRSSVKATESDNHTQCVKSVLYLSTSMGTNMTAVFHYKKCSISLVAGRKATPHQSK